MHSAVVILQNDPGRAQDLVSEVKSVTDTVFSVRSLQELYALLAEFPVETAVVDLGLVSIPEIIRLHCDLRMEIVCTHHTPDDVMWADALEAGALDCCFDDDGPAICRAILQNWMTSNQVAS